MPPKPRFRSRRTLAPQPSPPGLYVSTYTPELGAEICRRLAVGESLRSICRRDPAMPTERTVWNWARAHPAFANMKRHALNVARAAALAAQGEADLARRAARASARKAVGRTGRPSGYSREVVDPILAPMMGGETLAEICAQPGRPSVATVFNWLRRYPEFLERYRWAKDRAPDIMAGEACEDLPWLGERESYALLRRTVRESDKRAARLSLKRYAPWAGPTQVTMAVEEPDGVRRTIYGGAAGVAGPVGTAPTGAS
ncbi:hypothetical protein [Phenylobacterium sp.]|jgi:hypothetical protein|uniref:terminase small subunit-like protein n=1 Tax=Phenylobacterium sp. TaxID=1871053 RepID=UPI002E381BA7|nr:hypothetical protein [Phenylobacterium sp.]HEX3367074.1 hypothetical protein [Phenylobacterium sp.]